MKLTITEPVNRPGSVSRHNDWIAWLKTDDGIHVKVQIGYGATEAEAQAIIQQMTAEKAV